MKKTAIYIRVSSITQAKEGDSIPAQREALHKYIDDHSDLIFASEYLDDGISGTKNDREEFQRLLSDVKNGLIDLILITKMDRLHRSLRNFLNMQDILDRYHCNWLAIWEPMYDSSTPQGKMIINTMMNLAQFEAENTGSRIRQVQAYKVSQGEVISGNTPPGYKIMDKHLVQNDDADGVIQCFEHYSMTGSLNDTLRFSAQFHGMPRSQAAFKKMLMNEKYIGRCRGNEKFCTPLISTELFDDVQRKLKMNVKVSQKRTYIFSGLLVCGECGRKLGSQVRTYHYLSGDKKVISYRCAAHYNGGIQRCSNPKAIKEHMLEKYLLENLKTWVSDIVVEYSENEKPTEDNRTRISALKRKITRLKELYVDELISIDEYKTDKEKYESEIQKLENQTPKKITDLSSLKKIMDMDIQGHYESLSREEKRFFWRSIFRQIKFGSDRSITPDILL